VVALLEGAIFISIAGIDRGDEGDQLAVSFVVHAAYVPTY
jgi:hypothetical protein